MAHVRIDTSLITNWESFHLVFKQQCGFPEFYGMNMNAWIDCLTYLDEGDGMSKYHLEQNEMLHIEITETKKFKSLLPEILDALVEDTAAVNQRYLEDGKPPLLSLIFLKHS